MFALTQLLLVHSHTKPEHMEEPSTRTEQAVIKLRYLATMLIIDLRVSLYENILTTILTVCTFSLSLFLEN